MPTKKERLKQSQDAWLKLEGQRKARKTKREGNKKIKPVIVCNKEGNHSTIQILSRGLKDCTIELQLVVKVNGKKHDFTIIKG